MGCGMVQGLIRLIPTSFWFVMIRSTGASWFPPTQGVAIALWHAPIGAAMLMRHSSTLRSLIHMDRRVAWHLVKKVMMSTIKKRKSIGLRLSFSFLDPMVNTKADLNIICIYFKCFLSVQLVKVLLSVLVISSYFFSLSLSPSLVTELSEVQFGLKSYAWFHDFKPNELTYLKKNINRGMDLRTCWGIASTLHIILWGACEKKNLEITV